MSKLDFERKIEQIEALRSASDVNAANNLLLKALKERSNYLVSKAAAVSAYLQLSDLVPDLIAAFDRFMIDPVKSDPQCWAKTAIAKALKDLEHRDPKVFLRATSHVQFEPVWGGRQDSAAALRGTCMLALVNCEMDDLEILEHFASGLADAEKPVRIDSAIAIGELNRPEGTLLLRLKALLGDNEPEVIGQCFTSLLELARPDTIRFISQFLHEQADEIRFEAAAALAQSRIPEAVDIVKDFWRQRLSLDIRRGILLSLGASPLAQAAELLLFFVVEESAEVAVVALKALARSRFRSCLNERVAEAVKRKGDALLKEVFEEEFVAADTKKQASDADSER
jgi:HEAT repeat protein